MPGEGPPVSGVLLGCGIRVSAPHKGVGRRAEGCEQTAGRLGTGLQDTRENDGETLKVAGEGWPLQCECEETRGS